MQKPLAPSGRHVSLAAEKNMSLLWSLRFSDSIHYKHDAPTVLSVQADRSLRALVSAYARSTLNTYAAAKRVYFSAASRLPTGESITKSPFLAKPVPFLADA